MQKENIAKIWISEFVFDSVSCWNLALMFVGSNSNWDRGNFLTPIHEQKKTTAVAHGRNQLRIDN